MTKIKIERKKNKFLFWVMLFCVLFCFSFINQQQEKRISLTQTTRYLKNNKKVTYDTDIFYNFDRGVMITHQVEPFEHYIMTDSKGEIRIYYPLKNEVYISRDPSQITEHSLFYYFLSNRLFDFGLRDMGFTILKTEPKKDVMVTWWTLPVNSSNPVKKVELVHQNFLPIYMAYYSKKNTIQRKVYYYDYTNNKKLPVSFPQKVVEFNYLENGDSLVSQMIFSNILYGNEAKNTTFDYKIPLNAKVIKNE